MPLKAVPVLRSFDRLITRRLYRTGSNAVLQDIRRQFKHLKCRVADRGDLIIHQIL